MTVDALQRLPLELLDKASKGTEYAWRLSDIPAVIEAARKSGLVSIGGQLQFRLPDGGICECWWIEIDTFPGAPETLPWPERVERAAAFAMAKFQDMPNETHLIAEGRKAFGEHFMDYERQGGQVQDLMWFVWCLDGPADSF